MLPLYKPNRYRLNQFPPSPWFHLLLLLLWLIIGAILRFSRLESLPPWTDECATIVFSLGNSFRTVPLNQLISADVLLSPLQPTPDAGIGAVVDRLMQESTHPPAYFVLTHLWMKLFPTEEGFVSIWGARSLSALLGVLSIPAMFGLGYLTFRSRLVGHITAIIMAVSPYGIFLARDARHYTLAILLVIASLSCLVTAIQAIQHQKPLPISVGLAWVGVNSLGMATHYFFSLTIAAEAIVLLVQAWQNISHPTPHVVDRNPLLQPHWRRIYAVAAGTLIGCLVWFPAFQSINGSEPTTWIYDGNPMVEGLAPIGRVLIWVLSMVLLFPSAVTIVPIWMIVISGLITLIVLAWIIPYLTRGFKLQLQNPDSCLAIQILGGYSLGAIALVFLLTYGLGMDLTLGARFQFIYFPVIITLIGATLAGVRNLVHLTSNKPNNQTETPPIPHSPLPTPHSPFTIISIMGLVGSLTVIWNVGYLQNHRPDLLAPIIQQSSQVPVLIATTHKHHGQTGRMMGLAWQFKHRPEANFSGATSLASAQFFLAHRDPETRSYKTAVKLLEKKLSTLSRPLDLWLIDFRANVDLKSQNCFRDSRQGAVTGEYKYKLYHCVDKIEKAEVNA